MNILIFSQYYYPEQFLINDIAEELVKDRNQVVVVTGLPNYPSGVIPKEYRNGHLRDETINGVRVIRCPIVARGHNALRKLINYLSYMFSAGKQVKKIDFDADVVFSYQLTPITQVYPAIKYCRKHNLKLFMYNCDLAPMSGSGTFVKSSFLIKPYAKFSKWVMNSCDYIGVTSKLFVDYNHRVNDVPIEKMYYLPQHASDVMLSVDVSSEKNEYVDFMFAGNIGRGASLETVVKAVERIDENNRKKMRIHVVGDGSFLPNLKNLVKESELENTFVFHGHRSMEEMPEMYKKADVLLVTLRKGQITVPGKLQTYMTTGKPIFGAMDGSGQELIINSECGVCAPAEDDNKLSQFLLDYVEHPEKYAQCGKNGKKYFSLNFKKEIYMKRLYGCLKKMAKTNGD